MMRQKLNILVIIAVLLFFAAITLLDKREVQAFDPAVWTVSPMHGPNLVNAFDTAHMVSMPYPPLGSRNDWLSWKGGAYDGPIPKFSDYGVGGNADIGAPGALIGGNTASFIRVTWTGKDTITYQYIHLTNYAAVSASPELQMNYQNVGCGSVTMAAGDWSCYDYIRLYYYLNGYANGGVSSEVSQRVSLYDGSVTRSSSAVPVQVETDPDPYDLVIEKFTNHITLSLKYMANQYDAGSGTYFNVSRIADYIINGLDTDYSQWPMEPLISEGYPSGSRSVIIYYDYLTLGAESALPEYDMPSTTITTEYSGPFPIGARIEWTPVPAIEQTPSVPITGYHIYRSEGAGNSGDPYVSVMTASSAENHVVDTGVLGGRSYCYKVLPMVCGPGTDPNTIKANTVNASYHEPLLSSVSEVCGYIDPMPTSTITPTATPTWYDPALTTPTLTPTATLTLPPTDLGFAEVFPNPFNPNAGSGKFKVAEVPDGTEIKIFSMDGSLVKDGVFSASQRYFTWDGKNKNGTKVVSGLYYLILKTPEGTTNVYRVIVCYKCDPVYKP